MKKVLIVDDVKSWRDYHSEIIFEILNNAVTIITADCASKAYDILLSQEQFDYIITDLQMEDDYYPKYAGEWLVEQIKTFEIYKNTKIIMISASYKIREIAKNYNVDCIPKSTAIKCLSAYKELIK